MKEKDLWQEAFIDTSGSTFEKLYTDLQQLTVDHFGFQAEQHAEAQRQDVAQLAAEYDKRVVKLNVELRSALDIAERSAMSLSTAFVSPPATVIGSLCRYQLW